MSAAADRCFHRTAREPGVCDDCQRERAAQYAARREQAALAALTGLLASYDPHTPESYVAGAAVRHADALLAELDPPLMRIGDQRWFLALAELDQLTQRADDLRDALAKRHGEPTAMACDPEWAEYLEAKARAGELASRLRRARP